MSQWHTWSLRPELAGAVMLCLRAINYLLQRDAPVRKLGIDYRRELRTCRMKPYGVPKDGQQDFTARARPVLAFGPRLQFEPFRRATIRTVTKRVDGNVNAAEQLGPEQA